MGSHTDLDQDNIMTTNYGELLKACQQELEAHFEELKMRQGIIKQENIIVPVEDKSKANKKNTYNSLETIGPRFTPAAHYSNPTGVLLPVRPVALAGPTG
uniref:Uncharacterized protein n=1 Tax=Oryza rufipogon TaxID=4529 RepID=A0A0E0MVH2_ORYRU